MSGSKGVIFMVLEEFWLLDCRKVLDIRSYKRDWLMVMLDKFSY